MSNALLALGVVILLLYLAERQGHRRARRDLEANPDAERDRFFTVAKQLATTTEAHRLLEDAYTQMEQAFRIACAERNAALEVAKSHDVKWPDPTDASSWPLIDDTWSERRYGGTLPMNLDALDADLAALPATQTIAISYQCNPSPSWLTHMKTRGLVKDVVEFKWRGPAERVRKEIQVYMRAPEGYFLVPMSGANYRWFDTEHPILFTVTCRRPPEPTECPTIHTITIGIVQTVFQETPASLPSLDLEPPISATTRINSTTPTEIDRPTTEAIDDTRLAALVEVGVREELGRMQRAGKVLLTRDPR